MRKEKYLQIFNYLKEFSKLRSNPVRDIESQEGQYPEILWLSEIPDNSSFENVIREGFDHEKDFWLRIKKPIEPEKPSFPKINKILEIWVEPTSLLNEEEVPVLKEKVEYGDKILLLSDYPDIQKTFEKYVDQKWIDDLIEYKGLLSEYKKIKNEYDKLNNSYKEFFRIFNKAQQFGEEYELIVGVGLINYKANSESPKIFRHIMTQRVEIKFEYSRKDSQIIVSPNIESLPQIETDSILDLNEYFETQNIIDAEKETENYIKEKRIYTLLDHQLIEDALQIFVERISPEGKYERSILKPKETNSKPLMFFSPALILRKRNTRSLTNLYQKIIENIENAQFDLIIPTIEELVGDISREKDFYKEDVSNSSDFKMILFPKEYNDEQIEIIKKVSKSNKVVVQGPPGTGKSHTIANLICHLLAHGKKLLITAYTKRALEVLKNHLPDEFKNLTVNLLSSDADSIQDLQRSVNSINDELSRENLGYYIQKTTSLEKELNQEREKIAINRNEIVKVKEKTTRNIEINQRYSGTLMKISEKLEVDAAKYEWYKDSFCTIDSDREIKDLEEFVVLNERFSKIDVSDLSQEIPEPQYLLSVDIFKRYLDIKDEIDAYKSKFLNPKIKCDDFDNLKNRLVSIKALSEKADSLKIAQKEEIIESCLNDGTKKWMEKIDCCRKIIAEVTQSIDLKKIDMNIEIKYPENKSLKQLKNDASILFDYLNEGNQLSGVSFSLKRPFLSKEIKERIYFIENVYVNGSPCDTLQEFEIVLNDLYLQQQINALVEIFNEIPSEYKSYSAKFSYFTDLIEKISQLISIIDFSHFESNKIFELSMMKVPPFYKSVSEIIDEVNYASLLNQKEKMMKAINDVGSYLKYKTTHKISEEILNSINQYDLKHYEYLLAEIGKILIKKREYTDYLNLKEKVSKVFPNLVQQVILNKVISNNFKELREAIYFKHARETVAKKLDGDYENKLYEDLRFSEEREKKLIAQLASKKSWIYVLQELDKNKSLKQDLNAFAQFAKKAKGTGKKAAKFQKDVQIQMEKCKDSVPCWIMPLYKVVESIIPSQGMYDYTIIDEASQLGPDAIFLLYISKNVIIVGDDKQIAPENVGIEANKMTPQIEKYLHDFNHKNCFDPDFSFFDFANIFCNERVVLREHFRCMPEIIEFSNKNFYAPEGKELYPLKQYKENRIEPLMTVFCENGYVEGRDSYIRNEPEAEAISMKISEIINDSRYDGKTIGIITLQGNSQSKIIEDKVLRIIGEKEYHQRKIVCGNSAYFQGDERDIIFLSLVTAHNHPRSALTSPAWERRFNVAVSRAKEQVWLFHSVQLEDLSNPDDLRYKLLYHFKNFNLYQPILSKQIDRRIGNQPEPFDSWFEVDVYNDIIRRNLSVIPQYRVAKGRYVIDLVTLFPDGTKLAIECDGDEWHGPEKHEKDMMRQKDLERNGWQFFRVKGHQYYFNRAKALEPLWKMIENIKKPNIPIEKEIHPYSNESHKPKNEFVVENKRNDEEYVEKNPATESVYNRIDENKTEEAFVSKEEAIIHSDEAKIIRYFNLFKYNCTYVLTDDNPLDADFVLPIKSNENKGFLLQCYRSGHVNKVNVETLLSKKIGKEYMNGMNKEDELILLEIIDSDKILGMQFVSFGRKQFKAHLTEKIPSRDLLYLQGYKVMYQDYSDISYFVIPLEFYEKIERLIFKSFNAGGKLLDNWNYKNEWGVLEKYINQNSMMQKSIPSKKQEENTIKKNDNDNNKEIEINDIVKFIFNEKTIKVQIVSYPTDKIKISNEVQKIYCELPLAKSLIGRKTGEKVRVGDTENYVEILDVYQVVEV